MSSEESEIAEVKRQLQTERRIRQEIESRTSLISFETYLQSCHTILSKPLQIQHDKTLSTQRLITSSKDKLCPTTFKPWDQLPQIPYEVFAKISRHIPSTAKHFSTLQYPTELSKQLCDRPLASEKDLETYQRLAVNGPVTSVINKRQENDAARTELGLKRGIISENDANTLDELNEEVQQGLQNLRVSRRQPSNPRPRQADQICVYIEAHGSRKLCMIIEYKAPRKLSITNLRAGSGRADLGSIDLLKDVIHRVTIPKRTTPDQEASDQLDPVFVYHPERLRHTFYYMSRKQTQNFSNTISANPTSILSLTVVSLSLTPAISRALTICILGHNSTPHDQRWRQDAVANAQRAAIDYEEILRQIPVEERTKSPRSSAFRTRVRPVDRSPYVLRPKKSRNTPDGCYNESADPDEQSSSPSTTSDDDNVATPSKSMGSERAIPQGRRQLRPRMKGASENPGGKNHGDREYCTHLCLLGIVRGDRVDAACPNVASHRTDSTGTHHALNQKQFMSRICGQLEGSLDNDCRPLGRQGTRGTHFKITMMSHGYTFVAKGTVEGFIGQSDNEAHAYKRLISLQGTHIPVYLGSVDLGCPYYVDLRVHIVRMIFLSWAGVSLKEDFIFMLDLQSRRAIASMEKELLAFGVIHQDIRTANILRDMKTGVLMLTDVERSSAIEPLSLRKIPDIPNRDHSRSLICMSDPALTCVNSAWRERYTITSSLG